MTDLALNPRWEYVADTVMGGVSAGGITQETVQGRSAVVLRGDVSLDNNGGFVQMAFNVRSDGTRYDASGWDGIALDVWGNNEPYDLRLRTDQLSRPWQSFRTEFTATPTWQTLAIPFSAFAAHRIDAVFDPRQLRRIGILGIGRVFQAEVAVTNVRLTCASAT